MTEGTEITIKKQCWECGGAGIHRTNSPEDGIGLICLACDGRGYHEDTYTPFTQKDHLSGIITVENRWKETLGPISYIDFMAGKLPVVKKD